MIRLASLFACAVLASCAVGPASRSDPAQDTFAANAPTQTGELESSPDPDELIPVEKEPYVSLAEIARLVVYPDEAKKAKIEGTVHVRVLVGRKGVPLKSQIDASPSEILSKAATDAVMAARYAPAEFGGRATDCWISIPVTFRLR